MSDEEKMTAKKLLKLQPALMTRLTRASALHSEDANEIIRRGLVAELDRMEATATVEQRRMAKLQTLAKAQGGNIDAVLDQLLLAAKEPTFPGMAHLASTEPALAATGTDGGS